MIKLNRPLKKTLITFSVFFNAFFLLLLVFTFTRKTSALAYYRMGSSDAPYVTAAFIVSVPSGAASGVVFGQADVSLPVGGEAAIQFALRGDTQLNMALEPLYDRDVIAVETSGYGLIIKARAPGKTILQTFGESGIKNVASVTVTANE